MAEECFLLGELLSTDKESSLLRDDQSFHVKPFAVSQSGQLMLLFVYARRLLQAKVLQLSIVFPVVRWGN